MSELSSNPFEFRRCGLELTWVYHLHSTSLCSLYLNRSIASRCFLSPFSISSFPDPPIPTRRHPPGNPLIEHRCNRLFSSKASTLISQHSIKSKNSSFRSPLFQSESHLRDRTTTTISPPNPIIRHQDQANRVGFHSAACPASYYAPAD